MRRNAKMQFWRLWAKGLSSLFFVTIPITYFVGKIAPVEQFEWLIPIILIIWFIEFVLIMFFWNRWYAMEYFRVNKEEMWYTEDTTGDSFLLFTAFYLLSTMASIAVGCIRG